jgi:hypothetical protein
MLKIPETLIKKLESMAKKVLKKEGNLARCVNNNIIYTSTEEGGIGLRTISSRIEQEQMRFMKVCMNDNIDPLTKELILRKREKMKIENNWNQQDNNNKILKWKNQIIHRWQKTMNKHNLEIEIEGKEQICKMTSELFKYQIIQKLRDCGIFNVISLIDEKDKIKPLEKMKSWKPKLKNIQQKDWDKGREKFEELKTRPWKEIQNMISTPEKENSNLGNFPKEIWTSNQEMRIYTDGSKITNEVGKEIPAYAVYNPITKIEELGRINGKQDNFKAELMAIMSNPTDKERPKSHNSNRQHVKHTKHRIQNY